jgi:hypothetical protein
VEFEKTKKKPSKRKPVRIIKDTFEFEANEEESKKYLRYFTENGTNYVEFKNPIGGEYIKIKNPKVPIGTSEIGLAELKYTELQI